MVGTMLCDNNSEVDIINIILDFESCWKNFNGTSLFI